MTHDDETRVRQELEWYEKRLPEYRSLVKQLRRDVPPRLKAAGLKLFRVEARVKTKKSLKRKARAKSSIEDVVGVRVFVFFRSDIPIAEKVLRDMLVFQSASWSDKGELLGDATFGYRSIQFVGHTKAGGWDAGPTIFEADRSTSGVSVEVQIRTALENVWAEIDHYRYKQEDDGPPPSREINRRFAITAALIEQADENLDEIRNDMALGPVTMPSRAEDIGGWNARRFVQANRESLNLDKRIADALDIPFGEPYKAERGYTWTAAATGWTEYAALRNGVGEFGELGRKLAIAVADTEHDLIVGEFEPARPCVAFKGLGLFWAAMAALVSAPDFDPSDDHNLTVPTGRVAEYQVVVRYLLDNPGISATAVRDHYRSVAAPIPELGGKHRFTSIVLG